MRQLLRETSLTGARGCAREGEERERFDMQITWRKRNEMLFFPPEL